MARRRMVRETDIQPGLFDLTLYLKTAACVPALRKLVSEWREQGYPGSTPTTRTLLHYWFTEHKLPNGRLFTYLDAQREAIETLIYVYEVAQVRTRKDLLEQYAPANSQVYLPAYDEFARYCTKMATGSGKTKVMSLAIVWQYLNAVREDEEAYARTFLIIAPNVIVYERLKTAGVERWREYRDQLAQLGKKPILFIMMNTTDEAEEVGDWLRKKYPDEFGGGNKTLVIHTDKAGDISKKDLDAARKLAREVDRPDCPTNAIVSVLMLREGWDVQNVTVVVGLRPYTATANILPEQAIGRGLRLMFRGQNYTERVDIIGNKKFLEFVDDLERLEELQLDTFEVGKDKLKIIAITPVPEKATYDLALPRLTPMLVRKRTLAREVDSLDVMRFRFSPDPLPRKPTDADIKKFQYQAFDIITMEKLFEREYAIKEAQRPDEIVSYYAKLIALSLKLPSQFSALAPKVWDFFEGRAFGGNVDMYSSTIIQAMNHRVAGYVVLDVFAKALKDKIIEQVEPVIEGESRYLSSIEPFAFSRSMLEARKCVFNLVPCDNDFEYEFAKFLERAKDVVAFSKLPQQFGFSIEYTDNNANLRYYYPDFVVKTETGEMWLVETKGQESLEVAYKDRAAQMWCENATKLTGEQWRYVKVPQKEYQKLQPVEFYDLLTFVK